MVCFDFYVLNMDLEKKYNIIIPEKNVQKLTSESSLINYFDKRPAVKQ